MTALCLFKLHWAWELQIRLSYVEAAPTFRFDYKYFVRKQVESPCPSNAVIGFMSTF